MLTRLGLFWNCMSTRKQTFSHAASDNHDCVLVSEQRYSWPVLVDLQRIITTWPIASNSWNPFFIFRFFHFLFWHQAPVSWYASCCLSHLNQITNYAPHIHQLGQKYDHISLIGHYMCVFFPSFEKHNVFGMKSFNALNLKTFQAIYI